MFSNNMGYMVITFTMHMRASLLHFDVHILIISTDKTLKTVEVLYMLATESG